MSPKDEGCGSGACLVDRLEESLTKAQEKQFDSIKELMGMHYQSLKDDIVAVKNDAKSNHDEIYIRLRAVEAKVVELQSNKVEWKNIAKVINENEKIMRIDRCLNAAGKISIYVAGVGLVAVLGWLLYMYAAHWKG